MTTTLLATSALTHNALHTQAWSPSPCSHTIPRDRASEFILNLGTGHAKHSEVAARRLSGSTY